MIKELKRLFFSLKKCYFSPKSLEKLRELLEKNKSVESIWIDVSENIFVNKFYEYMGDILKNNPNIQRLGLILDSCQTNFNQIEIITNSLSINLKVLKLSMNENKYLSKEGQKNLIDKIATMSNLVCFEFSMKGGYMFLSVFSLLIETLKNLRFLTKMKIKLGITYYKVLYMMFGQEKRQELMKKCNMAEDLSISSRARMIAINTCYSISSTFKNVKMRKEIRKEIFNDFILEGLLDNLKEKNYRRRMGLCTGLKFLNHDEYF